MYSYLPSKPLQDGDNLFETKKAINKYKTVVYWLLNNSIDHKLSVVDSDTDWDDINNLSVYRFSSVEGPNAPDESQIGGRTGIVVCTSAGTGEHFQIAFTNSGAAFRTLHSSWFYIGHGIPADVDVNKLIDHETLDKVLQNYYTKPQSDHIAQMIYDFVESNYYTKPEIDKFRQQQNEVDSNQSTQINENRSYTTSVSSSANRDAISNAVNIVSNSSRIDSLSSSTNSGISSNASNEYLNSSDINSLSYSTSSSTSALSSKDSSQITSNSNSISINNDHIQENSNDINTLSNSTSNNQVYDKEIQTEIYDSASQAISSNGSNIASVSNVASAGRSYNFSYFTSVKDSTNSSMDFETSLEYSDASVSGSNYQSYIVTSSEYSTNPSFASDNENSQSYSVLGNSETGIEPENWESKVNSLASLNYDNIQALNSYVFNATHWDSSTVYNPNNGETGTPLKEQVTSNSVSTASLVAEGSNGNQYPLYNMSTISNSGEYNSVVTTSLTPDQSSGQVNALGSIYANTSNISYLTSQLTYNGSSLSASASSSTSTLSYSTSSSINTLSSSASFKISSASSYASSQDSSNTKSLSNSANKGITLNQTVINNQLGFKDKQGSIERNIVQIIAVSGNGWTNNDGSFSEGHIVGYYILQNPRTNPDGVYNIADTGGSELIRGFSGYDGNDYKYTGNKTKVDFKRKQPFYIRVCEETDKFKNTTNVINMQSAAEDTSNPIGSGVASMAKSIADKEIDDKVNKTGYVGSGGGSINILK